MTNKSAIIPLLLLLLLLHNSLLLVQSSKDHFEKTLVQLEDKTCSKKLGGGGENSKEPCFAVHLRIPHLTAALLEEALGPEDSNYVIRRAYIDTHEHRSSIIGPALDHFVTTRPWWLIRKEPFMELRRGEGGGSGGNNSTVLVGNAHIFLQRYDARLEPHLWQIAAVQYPPANACQDTRLFVGHMVNSGWGSMISMYGSVINMHHWAIFSTYDSNTNLPTESVMYANPSLCPDIVNKWHCAFMVVTNCTLPTVVTKCFSPNNCWPDGFPYFSNATAMGEKISSSESHNPLATNAHLKSVQNFYDNWPQSRFNAEEYRDAKNTVRNDRFPSVYHVLKIYGQLMRPNALYRLLIAERIQQFWVESREQFGLQPLVSGTTPCTAIHIRRGDRSKEGVDMNEFCRNHTRYPPDTWENCTNRAGEKISCGELSDLGCFGVRPFGGVTLQEYLDRAFALHSTRNVFIMTDDAEWLLRERRKVDASFKIYSISSHGANHRLHTHQNATRNGVEYHASLQMVQQCQALVGHWGSAGRCREGGVFLMKIATSSSSRSSSRRLLFTFFSFLFFSFLYFYFFRQ